MPKVGSFLPKISQRSTGFTIVELVLVLAIAGLIFAVVFMALRGLQIAARDHQRKSDLTQMVAAIHQWRSRNGGAIVTSEAQLDQVATSYMSDLKDPITGTTYDLQFYPNVTPHYDVGIPPKGEVYYVAGHVCGSDTDIETLITSVPGAFHGIKMFVVLVGLEAGSVFCLDSR